MEREIIVNNNLIADLVAKCSSDDESETSSSSTSTSMITINNRSLWIGLFVKVVWLIEICLMIVALALTNHKTIHQHCPQTNVWWFALAWFFLFITTTVSKIIQCKVSTWIRFIFGTGVFFVATSLFVQLISSCVYRAFHKTLFFAAFMMETLLFFSMMFFTILTVFLETTNCCCSKETKQEETQQEEGKNEESKDEKEEYAEIC